MTFNKFLKAVLINVIVILMIAGKIGYSRSLWNKCIFQKMVLFDNICPWHHHVFVRIWPKQDIFESQFSFDIPPCHILIHFTCYLYHYWRLTLGLKLILRGSVGKFGEHIPALGEMTRVKLKRFFRHLFLNRAKIWKRNFHCRSK